MQVQHLIFIMFFWLQSIPSPKKGTAGRPCAPFFGVTVVVPCGSGYEHLSSLPRNTGPKCHVVPLDYLTIISSIFKWSRHFSATPSHRRPSQKTWQSEELRGQRTIDALLVLMRLFTLLFFLLLLLSWRISTFTFSPTKGLALPKPLRILTFTLIQQCLPF